jgi:hypothetical protein
MPARRRRTPRTDAVAIDLIAAARRDLALRQRLMRREAHRFVRGARRMSWLLPLLGLVLLSTWLSLLVAVYALAAWSAGHEGVGLVAVLAVQVALLAWLRRDASATARTMGFPGTRRLLADGAAIGSWLFAAPRGRGSPR